MIITGCVAQAENQEMLKREPYIDLVIGPQAYHKINDTILNYNKKKKKSEETEFDPVSKFQYLKSNQIVCILHYHKHLHFDQVKLFLLHHYQLNILLHLKFD